MNTSTNTVATTDDLAKVMPTPGVMTIAGEDIAIRQFKVGKLPKVLHALQPLSHVLMKRDPAAPLDLASLFMLYADDVLVLLAVLADRPRAWVDELELDDAVALFAALLEVNTDFFIQKVLPRLGVAVQDLASKLTSLTPTTGPAASKV